MIEILHALDAEVVELLAGPMDEERAAQILVAVQSAAAVQRAVLRQLEGRDVSDDIVV